MSLTNEETEALAKCGEERSKHTNVYRMKTKCTRKQKVRLCRRIAGALNTFWKKNLLGIVGVLHSHANIWNRSLYSL